MKAEVVMKKKAIPDKLKKKTKARQKTLPDLSEFRSKIKVSGKTLSQVVIKARKNERY
jgi:hypothetical protein